MRFTLQASRRSLAWKALGQSAQLTHTLHSSTSSKPKINWQSKEHCCIPSESGQFLQVEGALGAAGAVYTRRGHTPAASNSGRATKPKHLHPTARILHSAS